MRGRTPCGTILCSKMWSSTGTFSSGPPSQPESKPKDPDYDAEEEKPLVHVTNLASHLKLWAKTLRRPARGYNKSFSEGIWRPEMKACRVIKPQGNDMRAMGFSADGNVHLWPEETLFLVERCKLEVSNITTAQLYEETDLSQYLVYAYFRQTSLIVFRINRTTCPVPIAFEAYAPDSQFSKKNRARPIMYIMYGRAWETVPSEEQLCQTLEWADGVPVKFAILSNEGGVFAVNLAPRPLVNEVRTQPKHQRNQAGARGQKRLRQEQRKDI